MTSEKRKDFKKKPKAYMKVMQVLATNSVNAFEKLKMTYLTWLPLANAEFISSLRKVKFVVADLAPLKSYCSRIIIWPNSDYKLSETKGSSSFEREERMIGSG